MSISISLSERELYDLECIMLGAFRPLNGFMREADYKSVLEKMRLVTGELWPIPITLSIVQAQKELINNNEKVLLKDPQGILLAKLCAVEIYKPDPRQEALSVFGSDDNNHPFIKHLFRDEEYWYLGGELEILRLPPHYDFLEYRLSADVCRKWLGDHEWSNVVGFQTRNPMHRSHYHLTKHALQQAGTDSKLLLTPAVGPTQACDVDYVTRVKGYISLLDQYPQGSVKLVLLPLAMRIATTLWSVVITLVPAIKRKMAALFLSPMQLKNS
jgi:sulfate adenylyltransferase